MEVGIHRVWNQPNKRKFYKRLLYQWLVILALPVLFAIYLGFNSMAQLQFVHRIIPPFVTNGLILVGSLFLVYKLVPDLPVRAKAAFIAAVMASIGLYCVHNAFIFVVTGFFNYNKIYGSFAALPILLLWILAIWYVILGGVCLTAGIHKRHPA